MFRSSFVGLAAVVLLAGCGDGRDAIAPRATQPALGISDGAHGTSGNQDFFFMPPIAANPSNNALFDAGKFNGKLKPTVSICMLDADHAVTCVGDPIKTFAGADISISDQQYHVNWNTKETPLQLSRMYRIAVSVGSKELGYVDVDPVSNGSQLRAVVTNEYIGLVDGKTLPIKFRIEQGATCENRGDCGEATVTNAGAIVVTASGFAGVSFPQGWLPLQDNGKPYENVVVKIERIPTGAANICHTNLNMLQFEGCYQFTTDPYVGRFAKPVIAGICPELSPSDPRYHQLSFFTSGRDEETREAPEANAPFVSCDGFAGSPPQVGALGRVGREVFAMFNRAAKLISPKSAYAIDLGFGAVLDEFSRGGWVLETEIEENGGNNQTASPGSLLPSQISVRVTGHHGRPVQGVAIDFTAQQGSVGAASVTTNSDGVASTTWRLGSAGGPQNATASIAGIGDGPSVTFYATAQQVVASVALQAVRMDLGTPTPQTTAQVAMVQRDAAGNVIVPPGPCTWAIESALGNLQVSQTGLVSTSRPDDGTVTATCNGVVATAQVEAGDYQFTASGSASDPAGDQVAGGTEGAPDIIGVSASVANRRITFNVDFEAGSVAGVSIHSVVHIDTDQSFATGHPGLSSSGTLDNTIIGVDYQLRIDNGSAVLWRYNGTPNSFSTVNTPVSCTIFATALVRRISCTVPLTALDYDEGWVNFKATAGANFPSGGNNGIHDQATNVGAGAATTSPIIG